MIDEQAKEAKDESSGATGARRRRSHDQADSEEAEENRRKGEGKSLVELHEFGGRLDPRFFLTYDGILQASKRHLVHTPLSFPSQVECFIYVKMEVVDIKTGVTEARAISFSFVDGAVKELKTEAL